MNRLTRITAILIQLQSKRIVTAKEIADRFQISLRTVYRDIKTLQEAGVPIGSENGVGYFIVEGYRMPPIALSDEEAHTLIALEEFVKQQGDQSLTKHFRDLTLKIKANLRNGQKDQIEFLSQRTTSFTKGGKLESKWLASIQKSMIDKISLKIQYESLYKGELTSRVIEPQGIYWTNTVWVTIAHCHLRKSLREFRLDRISSLQTTGDSFVFNAPFDLQEYFNNNQT